MKVFIDREYMEYLLETHQEWTGTEYSESEWNDILRDELYRLHGITKSDDLILVYISSSSSFMVLHLPPDIFAGTDDFAIGLNAGLDTSSFVTS